MKKTFVQLNPHVWENKDSLPSKAFIVKWIVYVIESLNTLKNAMGYDRMELDMSLSPENFGRVFHSHEPKERKSFFDPDARHGGHCAGGGGASAKPSQQTLEQCTHEFHQLMQGTSGPLNMIGLKWQRTTDQYNVYHSIKTHAELKRMNKTVPEFLKEKGIIRIDGEGTERTFTVLPLPADDE
jgi:hypothetical protein